MKVTVYVASTFTKENSGGNKAGVVLFEEQLSNNQKISIAKEMSFSETAFVSKSNIADFKLEYFTPIEEVPLCGHATIGTFVILDLLKYLNKSKYNIETKSGVLDIIIEGDTIFMEQGLPQFYDQISIEEMSGCFDINNVENSMPTQIVSTGLKDIIVPIKNEELLYNLQPNFSNIYKISEAYDVVGMHLFTIEGTRIVCRNFAPRYDIDEEAATGTSNCALAGYLFNKLNIKKDNYI
ncbi:MAG: PhzF family phenazine biosynthesis protein [Coprobacillaceae bacterium]